MGNDVCTDPEKESRPGRKEKSPQQALSALMRYASRSERSSGDAVRLMNKWGIDKARQEGIIARLRDGKFIDDRRFAEAYVRDKIRFGGWGIHKIRSGLLAKGIEAELAAAVLSAMRNEIGGLAVAEKEGRLMKILRSKERSMKGGTNYERRSKLIRFGLSRGFEYEEVLEAAQRIIEIEN